MVCFAFNTITASTITTNTDTHAQIYLCERSVSNERHQNKMKLRAASTQKKNEKPNCVEFEPNGNHMAVQCHGIYCNLQLSKNSFKRESDNEHLSWIVCANLFTLFHLTFSNVISILCCSTIRLPSIFGVSYLLFCFVLFCFVSFTFIYGCTVFALSSVGYNVNYFLFPCFDFLFLFFLFLPSFCPLPRFLVLHVSVLVCHTFFFLVSFKPPALVEARSLSVSVCFCHLSISVVWCYNFRRGSCSFVSNLLWERYKLFVIWVPYN